MRKERNLYGLRSHKSSYYSISLFLLLLFVTSCKSNQLLIDNNDVENVNFWFIGDVDTNIPITDCLHIVFGNDNHKTIIRDRKIIDRFVAQMCIRDRVTGCDTVFSPKSVNRKFL